MSKVAETKGFLGIRGKIFNLDGKEAFESDSKRSLSFGVNTSKENGIFVNVGGWKNSQLTVNIKGDGMDKPVKVGEQDAIDEIQGMFKNGDSVFIGLRADINTYSKRIDYVVNKIFIADEEIDFDSKDFVEKNELTIPAIITEKLAKDKQQVAFATFKGDLLEQELTITDKDIKEFFVGEVNVGDVVPVILKVVKKPIYEEVEETKSDKPEEKVRKTFKGKSVGGSQQKKRGKVVGNIDLLEVIDIDVEEIKVKEYKIADLGLSKKEDKNSEDLPF